MTYPKIQDDVLDRLLALELKPTQILKLEPVLRDALMGRAMEKAIENGYLQERNEQ